MRVPDRVRLALGVVVVAQPSLPARLTGSHDDAGTRGVVRILGVRYVGQALGGAALDRRWVPAADATVDLLHAASMVALGAVSSRHRRLATTSAIVATLLAAADLRSTGAVAATSRTLQKGRETHGHHL